MARAAWRHPQIAAIALRVPPDLFFHPRHAQSAHWPVNSTKAKGLAQREQNKEKKNCRKIPTVFFSCLSCFCLAIGPPEAAIAVKCKWLLEKITYFGIVCLPNWFHVLSIREMIGNGIFGDDDYDWDFVLQSTESLTEPIRFVQHINLRSYGNGTRS